MVRPVTPYAAGWAACKAGHSLTANPWEPRQREAKDWSDGWHEASLSTLNYIEWSEIDDPDKW